MRHAAITMTIVAIAKKRESIQNRFDKIGIRVYFRPSYTPPKTPIRTKRRTSSGQIAVAKMYPPTDHDPSFSGLSLSGVCGLSHATFLYTIAIKNPNTT